MELRNWLANYILLWLLCWQLFGVSCANWYESRTPATVTPTTQATKDAIRRIPDFTTEDGIRVWRNKTPVTRELIEDATDFFAVYMFNEARIPIYFTLDLLKNFTIEWSADIYTLERESGGIVGGYQAGRKITILWNGKISSSSLFHEWLHALLFAMDQNADINHKDTWWDEILPDMKTKAALDGL